MSVGRHLAWVRIPGDEMCARLVLLGLAVALQNALELPRADFSSAVGPAVTALLVVGVLSASLALLLAALGKRPPSWRWLRSRRVQAVVLIATLAACLSGVMQMGKMTAVSFQSPAYPNDGTTLDHYAAEQLLHGTNPYVTTDIVSAVKQLGQDSARTTPLHAGAFASFPLTQAPTAHQLHEVFNHAPAGAFESHLSYPALSFLALVPIVWTGAPTVVPFFVLCFLILAALIVLSVPGEARLWIALLVLADAPLLDATVAGDLDVFYVLLLFIAWRWLAHAKISTLAVGLAMAAKQLAWFYLPFYVVLVWRQRGPRAALARAGGALVVFAAINAPFVLANAHAWLAGVLAPQVDPMFPLGSGLVRLALGGIIPLGPSALYTTLEVVAYGVCLGWYWFHCEEAPETGFVLAILPLFFAWRSLTTYFYFVAVPAIALLLSGGARRTNEWGRGAPQRT